MKRARTGRIVGVALALTAAVAAPGVAGPAVAGPTAEQPGASSDELPDSCTEPVDTAISQTRPWEQTRLQYDRVHQITTGRGSTVAVVDTGVAIDSYHLAGPDADSGLSTTHYRHGTNIVDDQGAYDTDCDGHGTFLAGIIAAQHRPDSDFRGLAPDAALYPVRYAVRKTDEGASGSTANLAAGISAAIEAGVDVVLVASVTTNATSQLTAAIKLAARHDVNVVAAAGNSGNDGNAVTYPANYPSVIAVGALAEDGSVAETSQTSVEISVVAPGADVTGPATGRGLYQADGTSFAAGYVAATAALIRATHPDLTAKEVKRRIERSADHPGHDVPDDRYGWGVLNPYRAITAVLPTETTTPPPSPQAGPVYEPPSPTDTTPRNIALAVAAGGSVMVVLMFAVIATYRRGQQRGWRAATAGPPRAQPSSDGR